MIEQAIYTHPSVHEVIVIGIPDEYRGEAAKAFIQAARRCFAVHARRPACVLSPASSASTKLPTAVEFVDEFAALRRSEKLFPPRTAPETTVIKFRPATNNNNSQQGGRPMTDAVIVSTARTPIGKAYRGALNATEGATLASATPSAKPSRARQGRSEGGRGTW